MTVGDLPEGALFRICVGTKANERRTVAEAAAGDMIIAYASSPSRTKGFGLSALRKATTSGIA
jgi:hypothetical protein